LLGQGQPLPCIIHVELGDLHIASNIVFLIAHGLVGRFGAELSFPPKPGVESALVERKIQIESRRRIVGAKVRIAGGDHAGRADRVERRIIQLSLGPCELPGGFALKAHLRQIRPLRQRLEDK
jgi:hypothetical protein